MTIPASRIALEVARILQARRADAGRKAELGIVRDIERLVVVLRAGHRGDGAKNLLPGDPHPVVDIGEKRRRHVETWTVAVEKFAAGDERRALVLTDLEIGQVLVELALIDDRADMGARLERVVDDEPLHALRDRIDEAVVNAARHDQARRRRAALPRREERAVDCALDRDLEVGVVEHDQAGSCRPSRAGLSSSDRRRSQPRRPCGQSRRTP